MNYDQVPFRILVIDDHAMLREAMSEFFDKWPDCAGATGVPDINTAINYLRREAVDIVLLDYDLGTELAFRFFDRLPEIEFTGKILILSAGINNHAIRRLLALGAAGIAWKQASLVELAADVVEVLNGATWSTSERLRRSIPESRPQPPCRTIPFSARQEEVLRGIAAGKANKEIAATLGVSETSVKCTLQQIFAKTGVRSRSALMRLMLERFPAQKVNHMPELIAC
jgi:two-component system nitrate/nitrite response regulator NarL